MKLFKQISDAWINAMTGLGKRGRDKSVSTRVKIRKLLTAPELEALYTQNGVAARIIDRMPDDATREKFKITDVDLEGFDQKRFRAKLDDLKLEMVAADAWRWARLYGGSIVVPAWIDGLDPAEPLQPTKIRGIDGIDIIESRYAVPVLNSETLSILEPESYMIAPRDSFSILTVHASRVFRCDGMRVPKSVMINNGGWGPSIFERVIESLTGIGEGYGSARNMLHVASQPVLSIKNMHKRITEGGKTKQDVADLVAGIQDAASMLNWIAIDSEDSFAAVERRTTGAAELVTLLLMALVHDTGIPVEILLGLTPGGLNSGDNRGAFRTWYDQVAFEQKQKLDPFLDWILELLFQIDANNGLERPTEWTNEFEPLWQESKAETATTEKAEAEADQIRLNTGVLEPDEVRKARFVDDVPIKVEPPPEVQPLALDLPPPPELAPGAVVPGAAPMVDPSAEALTGVQITSLLSIAQEVRSGAITPKDARGIVALAFPALAVAAEGLLSSLEIPTVAPAGAPGAAAAVAGGDDPALEPEPIESPHAPPEGETLLSPKDIGLKIGVSAASVTNMHKRGEIEGWRIGGRFRFALSHVLEASHISREPDPDDPDDDDDK